MLQDLFKHHHILGTIVPKKEKKFIARGLFGSLVQEPLQLVTERRAKELQEQVEKMPEGSRSPERPAVGGGQAAGRAAAEGAGHAMERTDAQGKPNMEYRVWR